MKNTLYINRYIMLPQLRKNNPFSKSNEEECQTIIANTCIKIKMKIDDDESTHAILFKDLDSFVSENKILDIAITQCPDDESLYCCLLTISQNNHANQLMSGEYPASYYVCDENRDVTLRDSEEEWNDLILEIKQNKPSLL